MPVVAGAIPALLILFCFLALLATNAAYRSTLGLVLEQVSKLLGSIRLPGFLGGGRVLGFAADALDAANHTILKALGEGLSATEWAWNQCVHWLAYAWQETADATAYVAEQSLGALHTLRHDVLPALIAAALSPWISAIRALQALYHGLAPRVHLAEQTAAKVATQTTHAAVAKAKVIERTVFVTAPAAVAAAVALPWPRLREIERAAAGDAKRIGRLEKIATVVGITGLVIAALHRLGLSWTRCSKVSKVGKAVCGMDSHLLDDLLAASLIFAGSISVVELARECQAFTGEVDAGVRFFVRELN